MSTFCCAFLSLTLILPYIQDGKVVVVNSESKDLKRTAYRLRIPVERLKNAREALQEATDLAKRVRPIQISSYSQLGDYWVTLHRTRAGSSIKALVSDLRLVALEAKELRDYTDATTAAGTLLTSLTQLDSEQAMQLFERWPEPSKSLGSSAQNARSEMENRFRQESMRRLSYSDPEAALKLWSDGGNAGYGPRAEIAESLVRTGRKDQGLQIIDQAIADAGVGNLDPSAIDGYLGFVQSVANVAPDRFPEAFKLLIKSAAELPDVGAPSVKVGEQVLNLDNAEALTLHLLAGLYHRPGIVAEVLDALPDLKSKLKSVGGIDAVLAGGRVEINYPTQSGLQNAMWSGGEYDPPQMGLFMELRGKAAKDPGIVRDRLSDTDATPEKIQGLLDLASRAWFEDLDLASIALETARKLIKRLEPASRRASMFGQMLHISRWCDGEVDPELLKEGFLLVAELRESEKGQGGKPGRDPAQSDSDQLERTLISEWARDNFDAAIRYVRTMPDEQARLSTLITIVGVCRRTW